MSQPNTSSAQTAIEIEELQKCYPSGAHALRGVSLRIAPATVFGLLGPNGAGKTTTVRILTTLTPPSSGYARVAGFDVRTQGAELRRRIGYVAQTTALDLLASGRENLAFHGRLFGLTGERLRRRITELVDSFELEEVADRKVITYSGGMKRRLDIATGLLHVPRVLFLDEPTAGLDPQSRIALWKRIGTLASKEEITVLLTTHYMEEADALADRLAIIDRGRIVAEGSPMELKGRLEGDVVTIEFSSSHGVAQARNLIAGLQGVLSVMADTTFLVAEVEDGSAAIPRLIEALRDHPHPPQRLTIKQPTLDEVFLAETGRQFQPGPARPNRSAWS